MSSTVTTNERRSDPYPIFITVSAYDHNSRSPSYIEKVEFHELNLPFYVSQISMKMDAGGISCKSPTFKVPSESIPTWFMGPEVGDLGASTVIEFRLYGHRRLLSHKKLLGYTKKSISDLFNGNCVIVSLFNDSEICSLKIFRSDNIRQAVPKETTKYEIQLERIKKTLEAPQPIEQMIDSLSETFKMQVDALLSETAEIVVDIYDAVLSDYVQASREDVLQKQDKLRHLYDALFEQTIECSYLIRGYANKPVDGRVLSRNLLDKAAKFQEGFETLREKLQSGFAQETLVVTLGTRQQVDELDTQELKPSLVMKKSLRDLRPSTELRPKSTCMKGTRVETISYLMSWIADCSGGMMWCSGLAGTGKSSLAGTLHELLTVHAGGRNRLGAFIRYDRVEYSDASRLIARIAYSLGMHDNRIGTAISEVIHRNRTVLSMPESELFRLLLQEPLERLLDLTSEGPLVVMIDGMDEGDASEEMLDILSGGFGPRLPFIRLLVFSRPTEAISHAFNASSAVTTIVLEATSENVSRDIRFFIGYHFSGMFASLSARNVSNDLQEFCNMFRAVDGLSKRASGSFLWAATACRFVGESPSIARIVALLSIAVPADAMDALTALYRTILDVIVSETDDEEVTRESVYDVLGAMMVQGAPEGMTAKALDTLVFSPNEPRAHRVLARLGSVIHESIGYYQFFHTSFSDFLQDKSKCGTEWYIDVDEHKGRLQERRLKVLKTMRSGT
ncbi:hypothetical protein ARMSODRAFT_975952 [Armillaria solidipes]|uniref:Nephrocystin 3-like N-terminal domain-containing protein n=1 Tax=Armillaria solidipes TaxID=1076256 RepID=A0A2H3BR92_9AGAR|nr:hypothetical protein ARMSODRAFT_975952 [Armillaria solidipes]